VSDRASKGQPRGSTDGAPMTPAPSVLRNLASVATNARAPIPAVAVDGARRW